MSHFNTSIFRCPESRRMSEGEMASQGPHGSSVTTKASFLGESSRVSLQCLFQSAALIGLARVPYGSQFLTRRSKFSGLGSTAYTMAFGKVLKYQTVVSLCWLQRQ